MPKYPSLPNPDGWFAVCFTHELQPGAVVARKLFDRDVVLYRTASGQPVILDAHCPHMGAHLGYGGRVEGEALRCPFHGFRFAVDGRCVSTPYATKIPPKCKVAGWPVRERNGVVLVWHHHCGHPPSFEIPDYELDGWLPLRTRTWTISSHPQETSENSVDLAHFSTVHGYSGMEIVDPLEIDGSVLRISYKMNRDLTSVGMPGQTVESIFRVRVHGLGYSVVEVSTPTFGTDFRTYVLCTPIDEDTVILRGGGTMQSLPDPTMHAMINELFFKGFVHDVEQDFHIWENKAYLDRPVLSAVDGPIGQYRKYCHQFYG
jgi:nitrite reductase/ring-hydroxylating ferredoxin subunit